MPETDRIAAWKARLERRLRVYGWDGLTQEDMEELQGLLGRLETAETDLRLARELIRRLLQGDETAREAGLAYLHDADLVDDPWRELYRRSLDLIRREMEEETNGS